MRLCSIPENSRRDFLMSRKIANCAALGRGWRTDREGIPGIGTYFTFIRSRASLNHSWPRVDVRLRSSTESSAFSYVRSNFAEKFPRGYQLCRELLVRRYSSLVGILIIVNSRISLAREIFLRVIFLVLVTFRARRTTWIIIIELTRCSSGFRKFRSRTKRNKRTTMEIYVVFVST